MPESHFQIKLEKEDNEQFLDAKRIMEKDLEKSFNKKDFADYLIKYGIKIILDSKELEKKWEK